MNQNPTTHRAGQHSTEFPKVLLFLFALLMAGFISSVNSTLSAQEKGTLVQGTVLDEKGEPLFGVTVYDKGSQKAAVTNADGQFSLSMPNTNAALEIKYIGYLTKQVVPGTQRTLTIKLESSVTDLDEIVVLGFGQTVRKRDLTGAVTSIKPDDITLLPTHNALEALQGKVPGMDIVRSSGKAGSGVNITIRGNRSINGNNSPLFVIDGIQGGSYSDINPNDIESIEILKDASSTSIYGSEGANGVVIITTKKGKAGESRVNYDGYYGINQAEYPESLTGEKWVNFMREGFKAKNNLTTYDPSTDDALYFSPTVYDAVQAGEYVDWLGLVLQNGHQQSHNVSVMGGNDKTTAFLSLSYFDEEGLIANDRMTRYSFRSNINHQINDKLSTGMNMQLTHRLNNNRKSSVITTAASAIPFGTPYDSTGRVNRYPILGNTTTLSPILDETDPYTSVDQALNTNTQVKGYLEYKPIKGLSFRTNLQVGFSSSRSAQYFDTWSQTLRGTANKAVASLGIGRSIGWDNIVNYQYSLNDHQFGATLLSSWGSGESEYYSMTGFSQTVPNQLWWAMNSTSATGREISSQYSGSSRFAVAARLNYSYLGKYLFQATDRYEGSSVLGGKYYHFPSVSGAWRISDEAFMDDYRGTLTNLKLRLSYGLTGNSGASAYATMSTVMAGNKLAFGDVASNYYVYNQSIGNKDLDWEMSHNYNVGLDVSLWNRINMSLEAYKVNTTGILYQRKMPGSAGGEGFTTWQNICSTTNKGIELTLEAQVINTGDFRWNSMLTLSHNREAITGLIDGTDILTGSEKGNLLLGKEITTYRGYEKQGIWQTNEASEAARYGAVPGDIKIKSQNTIDSDGDGIKETADTIINSDDWIYLGSPTPKWLLGFSNTFTYKNFDFTLYFMGRLGQTIQHEILGRYNPGGGNFPAYFDYWTPENPTNDFPRPVNGKELISYTGYMSLTYIDGSYIKLKTVSLGYTLPKSALQSLRMEKARLYVTASNPWYWCKSHLIQNYDPERGGSETDPIGKTFVLGANITF